MHRVQRRDRRLREQRPPVDAPVVHGRQWRPDAEQGVHPRTLSGQWPGLDSGLKWMNERANLMGRRKMLEWWSANWERVVTVIGVAIGVIGIYLALRGWKRKKPTCII